MYTRIQLLEAGSAFNVIVLLTIERVFEAWMVMWDELSVYTVNQPQSPPTVTFDASILLVEMVSMLVVLTVMGDSWET